MLHTPLYSLSLFHFFPSSLFPPPSFPLPLSPSLSPPPSLPLPLSPSLFPPSFLPCPPFPSLSSSLTFLTFPSFLSPSLSSLPLPPSSHPLSHLSLSLPPLSSPSPLPPPSFPVLTPSNLHINFIFKHRLKLFLEQFSIKSCVLNSELPHNSRCGTSYSSI